MTQVQAVRRGGLVLVLLALGLAAVLGRLVHLQAFEHKRLAAVADALQQDVIVLPTPRGTIYGSGGQPLARDIPAYAVALDNRHMTKPELLVPLLVQEVGLTPETAHDRVYRTAYFTWIHRALDRSAGDRLQRRARELGIHGLLFFDTWVRSYPQGMMALNVLGIVGVDGTGLAGIEQAFEDTLAGRATVYRVLRGRDGRVVQLEVEDPGAPGEDIAVTLDAEIQRICERAVAHGVKAFMADRGFAIVLDARLGAVLALAQAPSFDPHDPHSPPEHLQPWAVTQVFEPGSTFKALIGLAAMDQRVVRSDELIHADSPYRVMGVPIRNANPERHYGSVPFWRGMNESLNVVLVQVAQRLGIERTHEYLVRLGFGERTGIELPGEAVGILAPPDGWTELELAMASFGQSIAVTGIQLAAAFGALANEGRYTSPYLIQENASAPHVVASPEASAEMRSILRRGLDPERSGGLPSARHADVPGYGIAGKSGTGEKAFPGQGYVAGRYIAGFGAFFPWDAPEYVLLVVYDEPKGESFWGADTAGRTIRTIVQAMEEAGVVAPYYEATTAEGRSG